MLQTFDETSCSFKRSIDLRGHWLLFLKSLFGRTIACTRLNQACFTMCVSAMNTYQVIPADLNLFFLDLSATAAIPNCFAVAVSCEFDCFESNPPLAGSRALD